MSKPKHTPEPWKYYFNPHDSKNIQIFREEKPLHVAWVCDSTEANAQRIVDCVNACEGIANPNAVPDLLDVCKRIQTELQDSDGITIGAEEDLESAIAKAEAKQ